MKTIKSLNLYSCSQHWNRNTKTINFDCCDLLKAKITLGFASGMASISWTWGLETLVAAGLDPADYFGIKYHPIWSPLQWHLARICKMFRSRVRSCWVLMNSLAKNCVFFAFSPEQKNVGTGGPRLSFRVFPAHFFDRPSCTRVDQSFKLCVSVALVNMRRIMESSSSRSSLSGAWNFCSLIYIFLCDDEQLRTWMNTDDKVSF